MVEKLKIFLEPLDKVKLSQIAFAIILSLIVGKVLGTFGIIVAIAAILLDLVAATLNKDFGRILSKLLAYTSIFLIGGGLSKYLTFNADFSFIAIVVFSFTEIIGSLNDLYDKFKNK